MNEQSNLLAAIVLSLTVLIIFHYFYDRPRQIEKLINTASPAIVADQQNTTILTKKPILPRRKTLKESKRISINTPKLRGSINLKGGKVDDLILKNYYEKPGKKGGNITILNPQHSDGGYWIEWLWLSNKLDVPKEDTVWQIKDEEKKFLTPTSPITIIWENQEGVIFERTFSIDDQYMFCIKDRITNNAKQNYSLKYQARVRRVGIPKTEGFIILHEGAIGVLNSRLKEVDYSKLSKEKIIQNTSTGGWIGFTDKYWLVSLIPDQKKEFNGYFQNQFLEENQEQQVKNVPNVFDSGFLITGITVKTGEDFEYVHNAFSGAKILSLLDGYEQKLGFQQFDLAVDFGWFYFVTKPLFYLLEFFHRVLGNLGLAIIVLTVLTKTLLYPMANKSFRSMDRMKALYPKIEELKKMYETDKAKLNQELIALYQKEKINPMSGCLPMIIQAPIFFCLYKVFFVTIEMRHAPFWRWIQDLSTPDPTNVFNLFGYISFVPPSFLKIGAWPIIMGITMVLQQRLSPQPTDSTQAKMMLIMPFLFTYLFASFPSGLVIYWTLNNVLSIIQQLLLTRSKKA
ncbi:MAG: membrane protein insertase YidC [Alphaproteobacteria bacterium]